MFETLGHYKILEFIGAGGLGDVYRARDTRLGRTVAIKVVAAAIRDDDARREQFLEDARAASALSHPNIAALYEIGEDQGELFLAFEFVPGEPLTHVIGGRALNPRRAVEFAMQLADALADAHADRIVHGDLKPSNVIVTPKDKAKILDFGLGRWTSGATERARAVRGETPPATGAGAALGTVAYMSPEQMLGGPADQRTDIFSLGVILFEMLTGRLPFTGAAANALALQIVQAPPASVSVVNRAVPNELNPIVGKALAKSLDQRYESAATFAAELRSVAAILDVRSDRAPTAAAGPLAVPRRRALGRWFAIALALAAIASVAWYARLPLAQVLRKTIGPAPPPIVAVAPFEVLDADPLQAYVGDGLAEDLAARLGQTPGVKVVGRSAMRAWRGRPAAAIAHDLGAAVVLEGSVKRAGDTVTLSLQLADGRDGDAFWTARYTKELKDVVALQAQIAGDIAVALRIPLQPTRAREVALARVVDPHAYDFYLRGRQAAAAHRFGDAVRLYDQAAAADAGLGEAFAGIASALTMQALDSSVADAGLRDRLATAARRAYEIDPDLPQANVAMANSSDGLADALKYLRRAIEVDPSNGDTYHLVGDAIDDFDPERALAFFRKSLEVDPRLDINRIRIAQTSWRLGRTDDAEAELKAVSAAASGSVQPSAARAIAALHAEHGADAAARFAALPDLRRNPTYWAALVSALHGAGRPDAAWTEATALAAAFPHHCEARAMLAALKLERRDAAGAQRLAGGLLGVSALESPQPADVRCGLRAGAALQDGAKAAELLDRIAANEAVLRGFAHSMAGRTGTMWIDVRVYPWSTIARQPVVAEARERLEAAYTREREAARAVLGGLP